MLSTRNLVRFLHRLYLPALIGIVVVCGLFGAPRFLYASVALLPTYLMSQEDLSFVLSELLVGGVLSGIALVAFYFLVKSNDTRIAQNLKWPKKEG